MYCNFTFSTHRWLWSVCNEVHGNLAASYAGYTSTSLQLTLATSGWTSSTSPWRTQADRRLVIDHYGELASVELGGQLVSPCIREVAEEEQLCSERRLHPWTIFVTCSDRLISAWWEWLFKEIEVQDDEAQKHHDDDAKKSHVGGSRGLALAANNDEADGSSMAISKLLSLVLVLLCWLSAFLHCK